MGHEYEREEWVAAVAAMTELERAAYEDREVHW